MTKPYVILSHYRTGSKMFQSMMEESGVVDAFKRYGKPEYNIDNLCADIYYNHDIQVDLRKTKPNFDIESTKNQLREALKYYDTCAKQDNLIAYSIRTNHAIQRRSFDVVFPIIRDTLYVPSYIITVRHPLDIVYSVHRVKAKIEADGGKMNPELSDDDVMESFMSSLHPTEKMIRKYNAEYMVYPDDFKSAWMCRAMVALQVLGCNTLALRKIFKKKNVVKMPPGYAGVDENGEFKYRFKYRHQISRWKRYNERFKEFSKNYAERITI